MKILIIGNGGREHAIGWKIKKDNPNAKLFFSKGNGGTSFLGENIEESNISELVLFAKENSIDFTIVGSENLLVEGIVDVFEEEGLRILGPNKKSAQLEGSKEFAKNFMKKHNIKTAEYEVFNNYTDALNYLQNKEFPMVIKADGLAAGKGVVICNDIVEATHALDEMFNKKIFGAAGNHVVIEEFLEGFEASILSFYNGKEIYPFIPVKDHKKIGNAETGLNTGGMGVIAPNPLIKQEHLELFNSEILLPTLKGIQEENLNFSGVIFFGLMITKKGVYLLEYNLRMGDPETQAILPLLESNFLEAIENCIFNKPINLQWKTKHSVCVVMASGGYPLNYENGYEIKGLDKIKCDYFIAGASYSEGKYYTAGGRVLNIVAEGNTLQEAHDKAYENVKKIHFDYQYFRTDIGKL